MTLFSSIIDKVTGSAMASNRGLSKLTSTTYAQTGTSLSYIRSKALEDSTAAIPTGQRGLLETPIDDMKNYALSVVSDTTQRNQILTSAGEAKQYIADVFGSKLPGYGQSLYDIQNAVSKSTAEGVTYFGNSLGLFQSSLVDPAVAVGNSALTATTVFSDDLCSRTLAAATNSVAGSITDIGSKLADSVASKVSETTNSIASAASSVVDSVSNLFSSRLSSVKEDEPDVKGNTTDVVHQEVKLYVEGVQLPFESMSIMQNMGGLPQASFQVPPQAGLMDIARYYQPKVHIFYTDHNTGGDRLLFTGHIIACNYSRSRQANSSTIRFDCDHKNALMDMLRLDYTGYVSNVSPNHINNNVNDGIKVNNFNSTESIIRSLQGLTGVASDAKDVLTTTNADISQADITKLDPRFKEFEKRLYGMPATVMNFWNQLKQECYARPELSTIMSKMLIPLMEDGIKYFDRMSGHYVLESIIQNTKNPYCPGGVSSETVKNPVMTAPAFRLNSISAIQQALAVAVSSNLMNFSGEMTTFIEMFLGFLDSVEYELITLASPADVPADPTDIANPDDKAAWESKERMAVETIIKPKLPFYYSPICNVILPAMFYSITVDQQESAIPTRITAFHDEVIGDGDRLALSYRAPNTIREAVAVGIGMANANASAVDKAREMNLKNTMGMSYNVPGKYEQGRGVKHRKIILPKWLAQLAQDKASEAASPNNETWPVKGTADYQSLIDLHAAWIDRYGYDIHQNDGVLSKSRNTNKDPLDPYFYGSQIHPYQRLLFSAADYEFTKGVLQSRSGVVDGIFNPYIIPGYPMDIIEASPNHPSFHGLCTSVTHSITGSSIGTSIGFAGAATYAEMSNYYMQPIHPWMQTALNMVNVERSDSTSEQTRIDNAGIEASSGDTADIINRATGAVVSEYGDIGDVTGVSSTIINNPVAKQTADEFYRAVLGVGAAGIEDMYYFPTGQATPLRRVNGNLTIGEGTKTHYANGGEANDFYTGVGNLRLVARPIEGKKSIEQRFDIKFIDLTRTNYTPTGVSYENPILNESFLLEPGASMFLDYQETEEFLKEAKLLDAGNPKDRN